MVFQEGESKLQSLKVWIQEHAPVKARRKFGFLPGAEQVPLQAGQVIEILGAGQMRFVVSLLKACPESRVSWMTTKALEVCPMAFSQEKINLSRVLFLTQIKETQGMDLMLTLLKSQLFEVMVFEQGFLPQRHLDVQLRKLSLLAEENGTLLCSFAKNPTSSYGIHIRVETEDAEVIRVQKVKGRSS